MVAWLAALALGTAQEAPDRDSFRRWLAFIQPSEKEQAYKLVGWRNKFWPAVEEARKLGRPILFWTMNGHPLGCT
ncbi:MAG: hypothetical protein KIT11_07390 [Fimbriimonadaceae bacterium]|nr:hypothetical protein [Fimbriimonadaceae bacterium]QYK56175.1 MAG: hypothetical protein KF733_01580 [Fimbriimonadaceae bacterium]